MTRARVGMFALCGLACISPRSVIAQSGASTPAKPTSFMVGGTVMDSSRAPVAEAEIAVIKAGEVLRLVVTGREGRFALGEFPAGSIGIRIRRLGYQQRMLDVEVGEGGRATSLDVVLAQVPEKLEDVAVEGDPGGHLQEFYERKKQRQAFGTFLVESDIRRRNPVNASELFRTVPGIVIRAGAIGNTIRIRNCQPTVWVDGQRVPGAELDEVAQPGDIAAIEFYPSSAGVPAQYTERASRLCGSILVWMKNR